MKNAAVVDDAQYVATANVMHTKQLAEHWGLTDTRSLTSWIAKVKKLGYSIGQPGERNRTYFNDVDQDLIKAVRYGTLTQNPTSQNFSETSEKVLGIDDRKNREAKEVQEESDQNRNLQLRTEVMQGAGTLATQRDEASYSEGVAIAKAELASKVRGYLETRVACDQAFEVFLTELEADDLAEMTDVPKLEPTSPKQLLAALF